MYTLLLQYGTNKFYLAPKYQLSVEEPGDLETINYASGCCGGVKDRQYKFNLYFGGQCSLQSAWALYNLLQAFLDHVCTDDMTLSRTVYDEDPLIYKVTKAQMRMINVVMQYTRQRVLGIELTLTLKAWVTTGEGALVLTTP